jgi:tetratricopeptide (TPR) repeat protein
MIAARLDALPSTEKDLVLDAAVIGKVFWPGALAAIGGRPASELEEAVHALERKEFVRRQRRSAVAGETQYAFLHLLVRDVADGEIPRARRVDKHRLAAQWIESLASDRSEDRAEMLAHHYLEALSLAEAAGIDREPLRTPATTALCEASERAFALNAWKGAAGFAAAALELLDAGDGERAMLQFRIAQARWFLDEIDLATGLAACEGFREQGNPELAAEAEILVLWMFHSRGEHDRANEHGAHALALVEKRPLTFSKAAVFAHLARVASLRGEGTALELAERALEMAEEFGRDDLVSNLLNTIGMARVSGGNPAGISDLERSLELAEAANAPKEIQQAHNNLANMYWQLGRLDEASEQLARARRAAERYGNDQALRWLDGEDVFDSASRGHWDEALVGADKLLEAAAGSRHYLESALHETRVQVHLGRGELVQALDDSERSLALAREAKDSQLLGPALLWRARALVDAGRAEEANALVTELLGEHDPAMHWLHELPLLLVRLGREQEYLAALGDESQTTPWIEAGRAAATGDLQTAAAIYGEIGVRGAEAQARLLAAERLIAEGRRAEADAELRNALAFFREVHATAYVARGEALLAAIA